MNSKQLDQFERELLNSGDSRIFAGRLLVNSGISRILAQLVLLNMGNLRISLILEIGNR